MNIEEHIPLAPLTTFRLGGAARFFVRVSSQEEIEEALAFSKREALHVLFLGGGSNMLVSDRGFDGLVIQLGLSGMVREGDTLIAAAGESWDALVLCAVREGLWGLENLSGIPGSVGAAPVQNIGAYGTEVKDTLRWLEAYDTKSGEVKRFNNEDCTFGYRTSLFKREAGRYVILRAAFRLRVDDTPNLSYKDLHGAADKSLSGIRDTVLAIRARKFPDLSVEGTAGSFFLNPVVGEAKAQELLAKYPDLPHFAVEGGVKLSLAWLLDHALDLRGLSQGSARLFERQPLVIAASRDARAQEVVNLAKRVAHEVKDKLGIALEEEVRIIA